MELSRKDCVEAKGDAVQEELENLRDRFSKVQIQLSISREELTTLKVTYYRLYLYTNIYFNIRIYKLGGQRRNEISQRKPS